MTAIKELIEQTYCKEKASEVLSVTQSGNTLSVRIRECPAVKYLHATGRTVSKWYHFTTQFVMQTLAEQGGFRFSMESYDEASGAACYRSARV